MDNFKEAVKRGVRFNTSRGSLSTEQIYSLSMSSVAIIVKSLKIELKKNNDDDLSFLDDTTISDPILELKFNVAKDIYLDKKADRDLLKSESETKLHNQKILELIKKKQDEELGDLSIEDLEKQLR